MEAAVEADLLAPLAGRHPRGFLPFGQAIHSHILLQFQLQLTAAADLLPLKGHCQLVAGERRPKYSVARPEFGFQLTVIID